MKALKISSIVILVVVVLVILLLVISWINHRAKLKSEAKLNPPIGVMFSVNGDNIHVYTEGSGDYTLVFMSGSGTSSPVYDFKPLWQELSEDYQIAVVEKSGYGWSDVSDKERDLDTMLEATRQALVLAEVSGPYVLVPHSMSGLEAIYWAQKYPSEIVAIVGLDACTPQAIDVIPVPSKSQLNAMYLVSRIGLSRMMSETDAAQSLPLMNSDKLTDQDKQNYLAIFYKSTLTKDMLREVDYMKINAEKVQEGNAPTNTPMLFFISKEQESVAPGWNDALINYLEDIEKSEHIQLDTSHYIHHNKADAIAAKVRLFLQELSVNDAG